jgi:eukaryotic-like serine/threonine-protein kinase
MATHAAADDQTTARMRWDGTYERAGGVEQPFCVGRFIVLDVVGAGGMGLVYAAYDPELDRKIAVKVVRAAGFTGPRASAGRSRLMREAQVMARLSHPNVVTVHDVGVVDDAVFIAMEFVDGVTLRTWLQGQTSDATEPGASRSTIRMVAARRWQTVLDLFIKAGRGLAAAHEVGVIHRDFKPDNVLVGRDGRVKVLDFGLAKGWEAAEAEAVDGLAAPEGPAREVAEDSQVGTVLGTPAYMAPEQHEGKPCDARADQFSFCVALWEGLYGARPFAGKTPTDIAEATWRGEVQPVPRDSRVPRWLHRVLLRGLACEPNMRYPDMRRLLAELERDRDRMRRLWLVGGVAAMLGLWMQLALVGHHEPVEAAAPVAGPSEVVEVLRQIDRVLHGAADEALLGSCTCPDDGAEDASEKPVPADR